MEETAPPTETVAIAVGIEPEGPTPEVVVVSENPDGIQQVNVEIEVTLIEWLKY
jgi:hypothetical protein